MQRNARTWKEQTRTRAAVIKNSIRLPSKSKEAGRTEKASNRGDGSEKDGRSKGREAREARKPGKIDNEP